MGGCTVLEPGLLYGVGTPASRVSLRDYLAVVEAVAGKRSWGAHGLVRAGRSGEMAKHAVSPSFQSLAL